MSICLHLPHNIENTIMTSTHSQNHVSISDFLLGHHCVATASCGVNICWTLASRQNNVLMRSHRSQYFNTCLWLLKDNFNRQLFAKDQLEEPLEGRFLWNLYVSSFHIYSYLDISCQVFSLALSPLIKTKQWGCVWIGNFTPFNKAGIQLLETLTLCIAF